MNPSKPNIVFMGTPVFAREVLAYLLAQGYPVRGVVTTPDKPSGRGRDTHCSAVKEFALQQGLSVLQPVSLKDPDFLASLTEWKAEIFVVVAFRMLPQPVWSMPPKGCFNLHASLLPQYRGAAPINYALINGEEQSGLTTFLLDEQIDTGSILLQEVIPILPDDDMGTLHDRLMAHGGPLVARTLDGLWNGTLHPVAQPVLPVDAVKAAPKIFKDTCRIHWNLPGQRIVNLVRGLSPVPAAFGCLLKDGQQTEIKIYKAAFEAQQTGLSCGTLRTDGKKWLKIACADGFVHLLEIQAPGKKRMGISAFLAGFRNPEITKFV